MLVDTDAVADANRAIELNPKAPKAFLRKGYSAVIYYSLLFDLLVLSRRLRIMI